MTGCEWVPGVIIASTTGAVLGLGGLLIGVWMAWLTRHL